MCVVCEGYMSHVMTLQEACPRERVVFHLDDLLPLPPTDQLSDDFFTVTPRDVHLMQDDLKKTSVSSTWFLSSF